MSRAKEPLVHGTYSGYTYRKCRCADCKRVRAAYMKERYWRNGVREREQRYWDRCRELKAGRPRAARCEVCGERTETVFDHDHASGEFRGWLCNRCNLVLGQVRDDYRLLEQLIEYLAREN